MLKRVDPSEQAISATQRVVPDVMGNLHLAILPRRSRGRGTVRRTVEGPTPPASVAPPPAPPSPLWGATSPVGGGLNQAVRYCRDVLKNAFEVLQHLGSGDPQGGDVVPGKPRITTGIAEGAVSPLVRFAVDLHAQLRGVAVEIEVVRSRGMLFAPVQTDLALSQLLPEQHLRQTHRSPKFARAAVGFAGAFEHVTRSVPRLWRGPSTMLGMVPLPQQAGGGFWNRL